MDGAGAIEWKQQSGFRKGKISILICLTSKLDHKECLYPRYEVMSLIRLTG